MVEPDTDQYPVTSPDNEEKQDTSLPSASVGGVQSTSGLRYYNEGGI